MHESPTKSFSKFGDGFRFLAAALYYHGGLAVLGLALVLPLAGVGRGLGIPYLYWHDSPLSQTIVGLTVGLIYWHIGFVAYTLAAVKPDVLGRMSDDREARRYVLRVLGPLLLGLFVAAYAGQLLTAPEHGPRWPAWWGLPLSFGLWLSFFFTLFTLWMIRQQRVIEHIDWAAEKFTSLTEDMIKAVDLGLRRLGYPVRKSEAHLEGLSAAFGERRHVFGLMASFSLLIIAGWGALSCATRASWFESIVPAAVPYCIMLGMVGSLFGFVRVLSRRLTLPAIAALIGFCIWQCVAFPGATSMPSNCRDSRDCEAAWQHSRSLSELRPATPATELVDDDVALRAMTNANREPIVLITTSGGGIRSAAWTVAIFAQLQQRDREFFSRVRLITGASGGMVGAAHWIAGHAKGQYDAGELYCRVTASSLYAPVANAVLATPGRDRGEALEIAWELHLPELADPLHELAPAERGGVLPSLVFAPMLIEDGSQMLMSNLDLDWYAAADRWRRDSLPPDCTIDEFSPSEGGCVNARQFFARVPAETVKISTAARINASFPYASPAVTLPFDEHPRAVDAGYYDNYGIKLATEWIVRHTRPCSPDVACLDDRPILLLELRDHDPDKRIKSGRRLGVAILHEIISPIQGLFGARLHVATHRNAVAVDALRRSLGDQFQHVVLHFDGEASLGWELTQDERRRIWEQAADENSWSQIEAWWRIHKPHAQAGSELELPSCAR